MKEITSCMTRNYTFYDYYKSNLKLLKSEIANSGEIYASKINNYEYYMIDVEINKEKSKIQFIKSKLN